MNSSNYISTEFNQPFIRQRADPFVTKDKSGNYYFTASVPEYDRIVLRRAESLDGLRDAEEVTAWKKHENGKMSIHIWAPELHYIQGKWYIYYAAGDKDNIWDIRPYVLECAGEDPLTGTWMERGMLEAADAFTFQDFSLDMTVFTHEDKLYCVWAEKVSTGKKISNLYIAEMESPLKLKTEQILLSSPDYDWERIDFWVNEGPAVIMRGGKIYITYSASATGKCYCMGILSIDAGEDLLDPGNWVKSRYPVLFSDSTKGLYGTGHNSFVKSEDGREEIVFYHARQYDEISGDPLYDPNRHTYRMKVGWKEDRPVFCYKNNY